MCGICGFVGDGDAKRLQAMVATLTHRGPDDAGAWLGDDVALGMRRLSIIDVETGKQPIFNDDGTIGVVFNGEIYNFIELRRELVELGHRFRTDHSDTEVIVHLYEQYGDAFLDKLNGMFAVALWDARRRRLLLARDRVGIKPLYYAQIGRKLAFGSEPKALLADPDVGRAIDPVALHHYFSLKNIPAPRSAFFAIRQLRPGELLVWRDGRIELRRWWRLVFREAPTITEAEAAARIRQLLEDSVRLQMRADVPVGAFLSGGVDSSSVVGLMGRAGAGNVKTFTLVYENGLPHKDADRDFARRVARRYGTEHHECLVRFQDVPERLDAILTAFDEPFSGVISTYFLTELIARHVKVALSGDGADELFGSYLAHRLAQPLALAVSRPDLLEQPEYADQFAPFVNQRARLRDILARGDEAARRMEQYLADENAKHAVYTDAMRAAIGGTASTEAEIREIYAACGSGDALNRCLFVDFETLLPDQVLAFSDRLSMAHSVELRPPFLDHRLVEFAASLPGWMKIKRGRVKSILKDAVADLLPEELIDRPKEGFVMPINDWLLESLRPFVVATLSKARLRRHGLIEPGAASALLERYYRGEKALAGRIWNLVSFQIWWERYIGG
jgi:asparagine synthase (glutamine-hydrolysing)